MKENSDKIRFFIRSILESTLRPVTGLEEDAKRLSSLPVTAALFIKEINQGYDLVIYDPQDKFVFATITISQRDYLGPNYFVSGVAAKQGYGPLIYELAMMLINKENRGLMPARDGDVRSDAWNVWERFFSRSDVEKKTMGPTDEFFRYDILGDAYEFESEEEFDEFWSEVDDHDRKTLEVFNTVYYMKPDSEFEQLKKRGQDWESKGFDPAIAIQAGDELWHEYLN